MRRAEIIARLKDAEGAIRTFGVGGLYLFGSHARGDSQSSSDIDVFIDPASDAVYDLGNFMGPYHILKDTFPGTEIGYTTRGGLPPGVREQAEAEAVPIF